MSGPLAKLGVPLREYREPPAGLSADWDRAYRTLVRPLSLVLTLSGQAEAARTGGTAELFAAWHKAVCDSEEASRTVLQYLHASAPTTWRAGHAILDAVVPIRVAICAAANFLAHPTPTRAGQEATGSSMRAKVAEELSNLDPVPLFDKLAAAVQHDCALQQGHPPTGPAPSPGAPLCDEDVTILTVLLDSGRALAYSQICQAAAKLVREMGGVKAREAGFVPVSRTKLQERVPILEAQGRVGRPPGPKGKPTRRKGIAITALGRATLEKIARPSH